MSKKYIYLDIPRLQEGKRDVISVSYPGSTKIEEHHEELKLNNITIKWNSGEVNLTERKVGSPRIIMEYNDG